MNDAEAAARAVEGELLEAEDRQALVLALLIKISDPDQRRYWSECAESLRQRVASKKRLLRSIRSSGRVRAQALG